MPDARPRGHGRRASRSTNGSASRSRPGTGRWRHRASRRPRRRRARPSSGRSEPDDLDAMATLDRAATGEDRRHLLAAFATPDTARVVTAGGDDRRPASSSARRGVAAPRSPRAPTRAGAAARPPRRRRPRATGPRRDPLENEAGAAALAGRRLDRGMASPAPDPRGAARVASGAHLGPVQPRPGLTRGQATAPCARSGGPTVLSTGAGRMGNGRDRAARRCWPTHRHAVHRGSSSACGPRSTEHVAASCASTPSAHSCSAAATGDDADAPRPGRRSGQRGRHRHRASGVRSPWCGPADRPGPASRPARHARPPRGGPDRRHRRPGCDRTDPGRAPTRRRVHA